MELLPKAYTNLAAATIKMKVQRAIFQCPDVSHLKEELQSFDVSTSTSRYYYTQNENISLWSAHAKLGLQVKLNPYIKHVVKFIDLTVRTTANKNINSFKWRL